ncbi:336_t:CDS:1, partial [Acaulospora morrowiae]
AFGELGCGKNVVTTNNQVLRISGLKNLKKVSCGLRHCLGLTNDGICYGWGNNKFGQLGLVRKKLEDEEDDKDGGGLIRKRKKDDNCFFEPVVINIEMDERIKDVACGQHHTIVLTQKGELYTFGLNKYGQLGRASPLRIQSCEIPRKVLNLPGKVDRISCGWNTTMALCKDNKLFVWGRNDHGQLGMTFVDSEPIAASEDGWVHEPILLRFLPQPLPSIPESSEVKSFVSGSEHFLIVTTKGECYAWGWNEHGNCGTGDNLDQWNPIRVKGLNEHFVVKGVGAGCGNSWIWVGHE